MTNTLKFIKLDLYSIKPYFSYRTIIILLVVIGFAGIGTKNLTFSSGFLMLFASIFTSYAFAVEESSSLDVLYEILPINKKNVVVGRYLLAISINIFAALVILLISFIANIVGIEISGSNELLLTVVVCFFVFSLFQAIQIPIFFKLGYTKAKLLTYLPIICIPVIVLIFNEIAEVSNLIPALYKISIWCMNNTVWVTIIYILLWGLIIFSSMALSYRCYRKREF